MLDSLLKIGEWQSEGKSKWDRFLEFPEVKSKDGRGNPIKNYTLEIIFDLDEGEVTFDIDNVNEYDQNDVNDALPIKMKGSNSKAICTSGITKRLGRIYQAFYGKEGQDSDSGQLMEAMENSNPELLTDNFQSILTSIFKLKKQFIESTLYVSVNNRTKKKTEKIDIRKIYELFEFNNNEKIALLVSYFKSAEMGFDEPIIFSQIPEYRSFLNQEYFGSENKNKESNEQKLCYASGNRFEDVEELNLTERYSLNKMFVSSTQNFASAFDKNNFTINYQVNLQNQEYLDYASDYLLHQGYKIKIAGLDHVIIPQFLSTSNVDVEMALEGINQKSDILFNLNRLESVTNIIQTELDDEIFWINYVAFDSDGNFFKSTGLIKDVSNYHLNTLVDLTSKIYWYFNDAGFVDWNNVMMGYDFESKHRVQRNLNFNTFYKLIPVRKDKEKINKAFELFKSILEKRTIDINLLYEYFSELMLCHKYERYQSYTNVEKYNPESFYFATRDSVFKYLALIQLIKKLNLINMDESNQPKEKPDNPYDQRIQEFFDQMEFNQDQKAMFYLGRMLNKVEYIQKGKTKTVIQKVNFNGMDRDDIQRLRIGLIEKAKQYNAISKVIFIDKDFGEQFNYNEWHMNPKEAVFFLLTGYSFGASTKDAEELQEKESIEIN